MKRPFYIPLFAFPIFLLINSCQDAQINPFEEETSNYSIYGALNIENTEHIIRVRDLEVIHSDTNSANLDATVTFHDIENGTSQVLKDSVIQYPAGYTHNFKLNKKLKPRTTYKVSVEGFDGKSASTSFTTPGISIASVLHFGMPVECVSSIQFKFDNVLPSEIIRWEIGFTYQGQIHWFETTIPCSEALHIESSNQFIVKTTPLFLLDKVFPSQGDVFRNCDDTPSPAVSCNDLDIGDVFLRYLHLGPEWNNVFPHYPTDPQDIRAVEDGLGFLGAYFTDITTFKVKNE